MSKPDAEAVDRYLAGLQDRICAAFEAEDGTRFREERFEGPGGTRARPRVLEEGGVFEKAAVHFTHARGDRLPPAASEGRPEAAGAPFEAVSVSLITHPRNPYVPTSHANFRFFLVHTNRNDAESAEPARAAREAGSARSSPQASEAKKTWWFGGGFDLTPYYACEEDVVHWHRTARDACAPFGEDAYPRFKKWCDEYFFLAHRGEPRGVGGLFFDDLAEGDFEHTFAFVRSVADAYLEAYLPIVRRRRDQPFGERERDFQLYRRGRYVEFNLVYDRGTRYGLQSGRRIESVLASTTSSSVRSPLPLRSKIRRL